MLLSDTQPTWRKEKPDLPPILLGGRAGGLGQPLIAGCIFSLEQIPVSGILSVQAELPISQCLRNLSDLSSILHSMKISDMQWP